MIIKLITYARMRGYPAKVMSSNKSHDEALAKRLWRVSEELTDVIYEF